MDRASPRPPGRDQALDALRTLAVWLMVASHLTRLIAWDRRRAWSGFVMLVEPFTAALFLTLVGASLRRSFQARAARGSGAGAWWLRQGRRAAGLWALSALFFALENGFQWPDSLTLTGILATIAYAILLYAPLVAAPRPGWWLAAAAAALAALHAWLDRRGAGVFPLNAGDSPLLPLLAFAGFGAWALPYLSRYPGPGWAARARPWAPAAAAALALAWIWGRWGFHATFSYPLGRFDSSRTYWVRPWRDWRPGPPVRVDVPYYNLRPALVPVVAALFTLGYSLLGLADRFLARLRPAFAPGRHSLGAYILHLAVLAVAVVGWGRRPIHSAAAGDAAYLGLIALCYAYGWARDRMAARRRGSA